MAQIAVLALAGTVISTAVVGGATFLALNAIGLTIPFVHCLLFGALISPTDPIAVLGILKAAKAPKSLEVTITGESLFNDGVGVVIFLGVLGVANGEGSGLGSIAHLFLREPSAGSVSAWCSATWDSACSGASTSTRSRS